MTKKQLTPCPSCEEGLTDKEMMRVRCPYCDEVIDEDPSYEYRGNDMDLYYI